MSLAERILFAIRSLLEDEPTPPRKKRRAKPRPSSTRQAVALVVTFKELFASGNLNIILEDIEKKQRSQRKNNCYSPKTRLLIGQPTATSSPLALRTSTTIAESSTSNKDLVPLSPSVWPSVLSKVEETIPLLQEERILSCPRIDFRKIDPMIKKRLIRLESGAVVPYVKNSSESTNLTVSLSPDDEKETVSILKKVLKWSPRKQNAVSFAVPLPKEEGHRAVAVVQNAVNRIKEEKLYKNKRKWKFPKLKFC